MKKIWGILTIVAALVMPAFSQAFLTNGLVAYYPFNGNALDASGNGNNGTVQGATLTTNRFGVTNAAYDFNGNAEIVLPLAAFTNMVQGTISTWILLNQNNQGTFFSKQHDGANTYAMFTVGGYSNANGYRSGATAGDIYFVPTSSGLEAASSNAVPTGVWSQVALVFSPTNCNLYINGKLSAARVGDFSVPDDSATITSIGAQEINGPYYYDFVGLMDDFRIYNVALSSNQISQLYAFESEPLPVITSQPQNLAAPLGGSAQFFVTASSSVSVTYQWYFATSPLAGATNTSLNLTNIQAANFGNYYVVVSDSAGSVTSSLASLTQLLPPPLPFLTNGLVAYYPFNGSATDASGHGNNGTVQGATLTTNRFGVTNSAYYFNGNAEIVLPLAAFTNMVQGTISTWILLNQNNQGTFFSKQHDGDNTYAMFTVGGYSNGGGYRSGATPGYTYFVPDSSGPEAASSNAVPTGVWSHVALVFSPTNCNLYINGALSAAYAGDFSVPDDSATITSIGAQEINGPYYYDFVGLMNDFRIYNVALSSNQISQLYTVESTLAPFITSQPQSITNAPGTTVQFAVSASSNIPTTNTYKWYFDNEPIANATNSTLTITNIQQTNAGGYYVVVSDFQGSTTSSVAGLVVLDVPFAAAKATVTNGFVIGLSVTYEGYGYTNVPPIEFVGGGGTGAAGYAVVSNGMVVSIVITNAGYGYTNAPAVVVGPPFIPSPVLSIVPMSFLAYSNLIVGSNYQLQGLSGYYWTNQPLNFTASNTLYSQLLTGTVASGNFRLALTPVPTPAFATPQVVDGFVVAASVTNGGSGYITNPVVTIIGGSGTGATAISRISGGVVTGITITDAGINYTNPPSVEIAPPPVVAAFPAVYPVMQINSFNVAPYQTYQIEFTPALGETWQNWNGGMFSPTSVTNSQYLFITNGEGFFQLQYVP